MGAAVASVLGYSAVTCVLAACTRRLTGIALATLFLPSRRDLHQIRDRVQIQLSGLAARQAG